MLPAIESSAVFIAINFILSFLLTSDGLLRKKRWKNGGNRQELHEKIRTLSMEAGKNVKQQGKDNNLLELIAADPEFNLTLEELQKTMEPSRYVGRSPIQVEKFIKNVVQPVLDAHKEELGMTAEINV